MMNIVQFFSKYVLISFLIVTMVLMCFTISPLANNENKEADVIQSINQYLQTNYVEMYDDQNEFDIKNELLKIQQLQNDLTLATELDHTLIQQAQTMLVQLESAIYHGNLYTADFYVDAYLSNLYENEHAQSKYGDWHLYTMPYKQKEQMNNELWKQLTEQEKISFILSMKSILLNQESVQYSPSTFYVLEKLEQSSHNDIANETVKTLLFQ